MKKPIKTFISIFLGLTTVFQLAIADESNIPEEFRGKKYNSPYTINYDDLNILLKASVVATGRSNRAKASKSVAKTGTRLKSNIKKLTALEGNRFYYESFKEDSVKNLLSDLKASLEKVPSELALKNFSKDEQLAYWLNLYNVTIINEIVKIYPEKNLEDFLTDRDNVLDEKLINVAGHSLSLNDIQYKILAEKYKNDPLIIYGLYQGIIGGPNIRKQAYTGDKVWDDLEANAKEFINSNRGTYAGKKRSFRVSSLYERNKAFFPDFETDLTNHLDYYLYGQQRYALSEAKRIKTNINDWTITDVYGTKRSYGGGTNSNQAALLDSVQAGKGIPGDGGGFGAANLSLAAEYLSDRAVDFGRFTPEQVENIQKLKFRERAAAGTVEIKDIESTESEDNN